MDTVCGGFKSKQKETERPSQKRFIPKENDTEDRAERLSDKKKENETIRTHPCQKYFSVRVI